jgi:hypothetical protein
LIETRWCIDLVSVYVIYSSISLRNALNLFVFMEKLLFSVIHLDRFLKAQNRVFRVVFRIKTLGVLSIYYLGRFLNQKRVVLMILDLISRLWICYYPRSHDLGLAKIVSHFSVCQSPNRTMLAFPSSHELKISKISRSWSTSYVDFARWLRAILCLTSHDLDLISHIWLRAILALTSHDLGQVRTNLVL